MKANPIAAAALVVFGATAPALAHTGHGDTHGLIHGFIHPLGGLDHVLAMVAVGLLAAQQGGRSSWAVPAAFVTMMVLGAALGMAGAPVPFVMAYLGAGAWFYAGRAALETETRPARRSAAAARHPRPGRKALPARSGIVTASAGPERGIPPRRPSDPRRAVPPRRPAPSGRRT